MGSGVRETHLVPTYEHSGCDLASGARQTPSLKDFLSSGSGVRASSSNQPLASVRLLRGSARRKRLLFLTAFLFLFLPLVLEDADDDEFSRRPAAVT